MANKKPTPTRRYTAESCHTVGYRWEIDAPTTLRPEEVERFQDALVYWTDEPKQEHVAELLADEYTCEEYELANLDELRKVEIYAESCHRETWAQSFAPCKKEERHES